VSSWWADEARQYGVRFDRHDERYARTREWLTVVDGLWREPEFSFKGRFYDVQNTILEPKPVRQPRPTIYMGGESPAAKDLIAELSDAYVMHGDDPGRIGARVRDLSERRENLSTVARGAKVDHDLPPMQFGVAGYSIVRDSREEAARELSRITDVRQSAAGYANYQQWISNTELEQRLSLEDYSVSNRGLRSGLIGTPEDVIDRIREFEAAGVELLLLQCSPQLEEMERFGKQVIEPYRRSIAARPSYEGLSAGA
jgi:dimethylsulfone monooxygenase